MNNNINPILYQTFLCLKKSYGAEIVHRRRRKSSTCIEIVFHNTLLKSLTQHLNTLKEAESCGYWVICRRQSKRGHQIWHGMTVFQLYLTPVHPKKRNEAKHLAAPTAVDITFEPIPTASHRSKYASSRHNISVPTRPVALRLPLRLFLEEYMRYPNGS